MRWCAIRSAAACSSWCSALCHGGQALGPGLFAALCAALWWKARQEEQTIRRHFPQAHSDYAARVSAIIPHVLRAGRTEVRSFLFRCRAFDVAAVFRGEIRGI